MAIITTNIDVTVFPNWLFGRVQLYTRKQDLLDIIKDVENDRIVGPNFPTDPNFNELRNTEFLFASETKILTDWVTTKKFKYDDTDLIP